MSNKKKKVTPPPPIQIGPFSPRIGKLFLDELNNNKSQYQIDKERNIKNAIIEIGDTVKDKYGKGHYEFGIELGNYTSGEYGSYCLTFHKNSEYCCNVIWDMIFGEYKIIEI
jgi:hypothetical protein